MPNAYREDLAFIHDAGYGAFAREAGAKLIAELRGRGVDRGLVLDLGCGSGILSEVVAAAGFEAWGVDISPAMIELARKRVPSGTFRVGSLLDAELPACVAIAAIGECFNYLFDETNSESRVRALFAKAYAALSAGGVLLFDISEPGRVPGPEPMHRNRRGEDWAVMAISEEDRATRILTRTITSFRQVGEHYRRDDEIHRLKLWPRAEVVEWLRDVGFEVEVLAAYGATALPAKCCGFLARKS